MTKCYFENLYVLGVKIKDDGKFEDQKWVVNGKKKLSITCLVDSFIDEDGNLVGDVKTFNSKPDDVCDFNLHEVRSSLHRFDKINILGQLVERSSGNSYIISKIVDEDGILLTSKDEKINSEDLPF